MHKSQKLTNDIQQEINEKVAASLLVANHEMGIIKEDIAVIKTHANWIKEIYEGWEKKFDKLDNRVWWILGTIVVGFLANLYFK